MQALIRADLRKQYRIPATWRVSKYVQQSIYLKNSELKGSKVIREDDLGNTLIKLKDNRIVTVDAIDLDFVG
jgi:hypothetical protein